MCTNFLDNFNKEVYITNLKGFYTLLVVKESNLDVVHSTNQQIKNTSKGDEDENIFIKHRDMIRGRPTLPLLVLVESNHHNITIRTNHIFWCKCLPLKTNSGKKHN